MATTRSCGSLSAWRRPARSHAKLPRTPVNFFCDLRLTSDARLSIDDKNTVYAAEWRLRRGERTWRMEVPRVVLHGRESEERAPSKNVSDRRGDMFHPATLWPGRSAARGGLFQRGP